jgi:ornithine cyclodeaminase
MLLVTPDRLRALVPMVEAVAAMREAFVRVINGDVDDPPRMALADGSTLAMMARGDASSGTVVKLVSVRSENRERGLPNIQALGAWLDGPTGKPLFLIHGTELTSLRTGAASGAATDLLAAPDAKILAVIGAGGQAADQVRGVAAVRAIQEVRIVSRTETAAALADSLASEWPHAHLHAVPTVAEAVAGADIVCCATNSIEPVLTADLLEGRIHVNAIGSYRPQMKELARDVLVCASVIAVDHIGAAMTEAGEIIDAVDSGAIALSALTELGRLLVDPPANVHGVTIFKSVGIAVQDWAIAQLISERLSVEETGAAGNGDWT